MSIWTFSAGVFRTLPVMQTPVARSVPSAARTMAARALMLGLTLPLAACLGEGTGGLGLLTPQSEAEDGTSAAVLPEVSLYKGRVVVRPPRGYCIDKDAVRRGGGHSFVLIASCEVLTGTRGVAVEPAMITVSVLSRRSDGSQPTAAEMAAPMAPAKTLSEIDGDGIALVHVAQGGDQVLPGGDPRHWRAGMDLNGHAVGLAVYGKAGGGLAGGAGKRLIIDVAEMLREASPVPLVTPAAKAGDPTPDTATTPTDKADSTGDEAPKGLGALFNGLFPKSS